MTYDDVLLLLEAPGLALRDLAAATERYERAFTRVAGGAIRYDKENVQGGGGDPDMPVDYGGAAFNRAGRGTACLHRSC